MNQQYARVVCHRLHPVDSLANEIGHLDGAEVERLASALGTLQIENVVDQPNQAVGVAQGDAQQVRRLVVDFSKNPDESKPSAPRIEVSGVRSS